MNDHFSEIAIEYSKFRPDYPNEMIDYIVSFVPKKTTALDVATGNGQVAKKLSPHFETVFATDISESQIRFSEKRNNVFYKVEPAEKTGFETSQFDLVTVAQAIHWFDFDAFYGELSRILKDGGIFAAMGYGLFSTNADTDAILRRFYHEIVGPYWDSQRRYIDERYRSIPFPLEEIPVKSFENKFNWSFRQLVGYLESWSATQHFKKDTGENPVDIIRKSLFDSWENGNKEVVFPLLLRIGRLHKK